MSLTAATAIIQISVDGVFPTPQQLQGFSTDDIYDAPSIKTVDTLMGIDGYQSSGFMWVSRTVTYDLQADSASNAFFDAWNAAMESGQEALSANGVIIIPAVKSKFSMINGSLTGYTPLPSAGKLLKPRKYEITWNKIIPANR